MREFPSAGRAGQRWRVDREYHPTGGPPQQDHHSPGGPGARASQATACITKPAAKGTPAQGDITGWQDAQSFTARNGGGGLARCHLVANVLGGKGIAANLVPCWQVGMNTGTPSMRTYEQTAQTAVGRLTAGEAVYYEVTAQYRDATSTIPTSVIGRRHPHHAAAAGGHRGGVPATGAAGTHDDTPAPTSRHALRLRQLSGRAAVVADHRAVAVLRRPAPTRRPTGDNGAGRATAAAAHDGCEQPCRR
ncbi:DNA/RNA non-specific endonuclease [Micromonospora chalcea]